MVSNRMQFERVCCLVSQQYNGRAMGPSSDLMQNQPHSLELDMSIYPRKLEDDHINNNNCPPEMIPLPFMPENSHFPGNTLILEEEKSLAVELAMSSMNELLKMWQTGEPLWVRAPDNPNKLVLNLEEYARMFSWNANLKQNPHQLRTEATRDTAVVIMNSITLVDAFLDAVSIYICTLVQFLIFFNNNIIINWF